MSNKGDPYKRQNDEFFDYIASNCPNTDDNFEELLTIFWATYSENDASVVIDTSKNG